MTTAAVQEFLTKVGEDEALQAELAKALDAENDRQAVTELADSKGYDFTPEELWAEVQKRQAEGEEQQGEGELSDEELEAVAGGEFVVAVSLGLGLAAGGAGYALGKDLSPKIKIKW
ncbi:MAG: Nif11-like leader peptide family natural product precursor [Cyanobacteria bacterium J06600_6]